MRGVARLDPASIIAVGLLFGGLSLLVAYSRRRLARHRKPVAERSVKVSDARIYDRYAGITAALEEAGIVRE